MLDAKFLRTELEDLGFEIRSMDRTGVEIRATNTEAMRLNLRLRTAFHVLQRFGDVYCKDADDLYKETVALPWERVIDPNGFISVTSSVKNDTITNSMFPNMRLKDAICDRMTKVAGKRPDSGASVDKAVVH